MSPIEVMKKLAVESAGKINDWSVNVEINRFNKLYLALQDEGCDLKEWHYTSSPMSFSYSIIMTLDKYRVTVSRSVSDGGQYVQAQITSEPRHFIDELLRAVMCNDSDLVTTFAMLTALPSGIKFDLSDSLVIPDLQEDDIVVEAPLSRTVQLHFNKKVCQSKIEEVLRRKQTVK